MPNAISPAVRRKALRAFKQRGYAVNPKALQVLLNAYAKHDASELTAFLDLVFEQLSRPGATDDNIISTAVADDIAKRLEAQEDTVDGPSVLGAGSAQLFQVIDAFQTPTWSPDSKSSGARLVDRPKSGIAGSPDDKARIHRARYELIRGKVLRNEQFTPPASDMLSRGKSAYLQLTGLDSLSSTADDRLVLGMLTQLEEGSWYLEDLHSNIRLDLTDVDTTAGIYTDCSFVIAQGSYTESSAGEALFRVKMMGMPPRESREESLAGIGHAGNLFGGTFDNSDADALLRMETEQEGAMILVLADLQLDNFRSMIALQRVFEGYTEDDVIPVAIVLMGPFLSYTFGRKNTDFHFFKSKFTELGKMIAKDFKAIAQTSKFVLVPSLSDPSPGPVLPQPPMLPMLLQGFIDAIGSERVFLASNPCRIRYMTQELVFFAEDSTRKMMRRSAVDPNWKETESMAEHYVKTIIDQSHLLPLPLLSRPVIWNFDQSLWLYPAPHLIVTAESVPAYTCKYGDTFALNPGSFTKDQSFAVYTPSNRTAQQCNVFNEKPLEELPVTPPQVSDDEEENSDSDSGHSFHSLRARMKGNGDDGDGSQPGSDVELDFPVPAPTSIAETQETPAETQETPRDSQISEPTQDESKIGDTSVSGKGQPMEGLTKQVADLHVSPERKSTPAKEDVAEEGNTEEAKTDEVMSPPETEAAKEELNDANNNEEMEESNDANNSEAMEESNDANNSEAMEESNDAIRNEEEPNGVNGSTNGTQASFKEAETIGDDKEAT